MNNASRLASCAVVVPIYRPRLEELEQFSLDYSLGRLRQRTVFFIAPASLDVSFYTARYPQADVIRFSDHFFASIQGYNLLLLDPNFYGQFGRTHTFMLVLQTDAILLRDDLDQWCEGPYDYVGAPWPNGVEVRVNLDCFADSLGKSLKVHVGNGGLSLRRNQACANLLHEFPQAVDMFRRSGSSEDLFFALLGSQSMHFVLPNERVASMFALELEPERYCAINGGRPPMGGHAWWRYDRPFWDRWLSPSSN